MNLKKLLDSRRVTPTHVDNALSRAFFLVIQEDLNEPLFKYKFRCFDKTGRTRIFVCFGWSSREEKWVFESRPVPKNIPAWDLEG